MTTAICTTLQARTCDQKTIQEYHIPSLILMEHAALGCLKYIIPILRRNQKIVILCGPGNNGADGLAIARLLKQKGISSTIALCAPALSYDEEIQLNIVKALNLPVKTLMEEQLASIQEADILIDALFGNGLSRPITSPFQELIEAANQSNAYIISIDIASGVDGTTGKKMGSCIHADLTLAIDCIKTGHLINDGRQYTGKIKVISIGIPENLHQKDHTAFLIEEALVKQLLPKRNDHSHKGTFGKALMIGGSASMHGAITMACRSCYHSGIGTLTCLIPSCIKDTIAQKMEFAMNLIAPSHEGYFTQEALDILDENIEKYDIISIGNGMGRNEATKEMVKKVLESSKTVLLDADACWGLEDQTKLLQRKAPTILTPHLKEMTFLCQADLKTVMSDPFEVAEAFCICYPNCVLVLKSDVTIVAHGQQIYVLDQANSALAKGGSGDILCGIITGLYGQSRNTFNASLVGVYLHAHCAKIKKDPAGVMPQDLIENIPNVFQQLRED